MTSTFKQPKPPAKPQKPAHEDDEDNAPDINALFAAVNDLPADDPLREPAPATRSAAGASPSRREAPRPRQRRSQHRAILSRHRRRPTEP